MLVFVKLNSAGLAYKLQTNTTLLTQEKKHSQRLHAFFLPNTWVEPKFWSGVTCNSAVFLAIIVF